MLGGPEGPASTCLFAPALLRVETIFREKRVLKVFVSCPTVGANCSCRTKIESPITEGGVNLKIWGAASSRNVLF